MPYSLPFSLSHTHPHTHRVLCVSHNTQQQTATDSNRQKHTATHCNTLQHTAEHRVACWRVHTHTPHTYRVLSGPTLSHILLSTLSPREHVSAREYSVHLCSVLSHVLASERVFCVNMWERVPSPLTYPTLYSLALHFLSRTPSHTYLIMPYSLSLSHTHTRTSTHECSLTLLSHIPYSLSLSHVNPHTHIKAGLGFVQTNVRIAGIQFTKHFIEFVLVETNQLFGSTLNVILNVRFAASRWQTWRSRWPLNVILTRQTCGHRSSRVAGSKRQALAFYFSVRTWYMFFISKCEWKLDLGVCMTSVLAKRMRLHSADFWRILRPNTFLNRKSALCGLSYDIMIMVYTTIKYNII